MANWRDVLGGDGTSKSKFRPQLEALDGRALPDGGPIDPPPDQPPAEPGPSETGSLVLGDVMYLRDESGTTVASISIDANGSQWLDMGLNTTDPTRVSLGNLSETAPPGPRTTTVYTFGGFSVTIDRGGPTGTNVTIRLPNGSSINYNPVTGGYSINGPTGSFIWVPRNNPQPQ